MKNTLLFLLAAVLMYGATLPAKAEEAASKPWLVVSVTSVDTLIKNVKTLGKIAGADDLAGLMLAKAKTFTNGIDTTKPCGIVVTMTELGPSGFAFVPVTDFKAVIQTAGLKDVGDGIYSDQAADPMFLKEHNGWAFISTKAKSLANLPDDPAALLAGQEKEYSVAVRVLVKNIPELYRQQANAAIKSAVEQAELESGSESEFEHKISEATIGQIATLFSETDTFTIGWSVDEKTRSTYIDVNLTAVAGSKMAKQFATLENATSYFSGFIRSDAAMSFHLVSKSGSKGAAQAVEALKAEVQRSIDADVKLGDDDAKTDDAKKEVRKAVAGDIMDVLSATLMSGKFDAAAALFVKSEGTTFAAGSRVTDVAKIEAAFKKGIDLAKNEPDFPLFKFDADSHKGVRFHTMSITFDDADGDLRRLVGDKHDVAYGFGNDSVYMAVGRDAVQTLKDAIDQSTADAARLVPPAQLVIAMGPIMKFAGSLTSEPFFGFLSKALAQHKGKDRIRMVLRPIESGASFRFEVEEGAIVLAVAAAQLGLLF